MTEGQRRMAEVETALDGLEQAIERCDNDEAAVLFVQFSTRVMGILKDWKYLCENVSDEHERTDDVSK